MPRDERRALVLDAARRVFARGGLGATTIGEIAREAGVTRQSVYEQFDDKRALFDATVAALVDEMTDAFGAPREPEGEVDDVTWLRHIYAPVLAYFADNPAALLMFKEADRVDNETFRQYRVDLASAYETAIRRRAGARGLELGRRLPRVLVVMFIAMSSALLSLAAEGAVADAEVLGDLLAEFTIGGFERLVAHPDTIERLG